MPAKSLRYFLYVSDAKVDMLLAQIPLKLKDKIAVSLEIDLKVISTTLSPKEAEENRFSRLEAVLAYFDENMEVGTVDEPQAYFKGEMDMWWDIYPELDAVYFGGDTGSTTLGLGGSSGHLIGEAGPDRKRYTSAAVVLERMISKIAHQMQESDSPAEDASAPRFDPADIVLMNELGHRPNDHRMEFLARRLQFTPARPINVANYSPIVRQVVMGSPLYVAMSD